MKTALIASASAVLVAACGSLPTSQPIAEARLEARSGSTASGTVSFAPAGGKVRVDLLDASYYAKRFNGARSLFD